MCLGFYYINLMENKINQMFGPILILIIITLIIISIIAAIEWIIRRLIQMFKKR